MRISHQHLEIVIQKERLLSLMLDDWTFLLNFPCHNLLLNCIHFKVEKTKGSQVPEFGQQLANKSTANGGGTNVSRLWQLIYKLLVEQFAAEFFDNNHNRRMAPQLQHFGKMIDKAK